MVGDSQIVSCDELKAVYIEPYLHMFSPHVRTVLAVPSLEAERTYVQTHLQLHLSGHTHFYVIKNPQTHALIGAIEIRDAYAYRGQLYCWLHEQYWGSGYFTVAMQWVIQDYFKKTGALFFNALVAVENKRSYYALKKCGFIDSGYQAGGGDDQYELLKLCGR